MSCTGEPFDSAGSIEFEKRKRNRTPFRADRTTRGSAAEPLITSTRPFQDSASGATNRPRTRMRTR